MSQNKPTILEWSTRHPLLAAPEGARGIFMWGFDALGKEIIWYVGASTDIRKYLRSHGRNLERGIDQIPCGFLKGGFQSLADVASCWERNLNDPRVVEQLQNQNRMRTICRAGRAFAESAFARIALPNGETDADIGAIKRATIYSLQPLINKEHISTPPQPKVKHLLSPTDSDWLESWRATYEELAMRQII